MKTADLHPASLQTVALVGLILTLAAPLTRNQLLVAVCLATFSMDSFT